MSEENERDNDIERIKINLYNNVCDSFGIQELDEKVRRIRLFFHLSRELSDLVKKTKKTGPL